MLERLEKGEIVDLYEHFTQPWFAVFCLNEWPGFKQELQDLYKEYVRNFYDFFWFVIIKLILKCIFIQNLGNGQRITDFIKDFLNSMDNPDAVRIISHGSLQS